MSEVWESQAFPRALPFQPWPSCQLTPLQREMSSNCQAGFNFGGEGRVWAARRPQGWGETWALTSQIGRRVLKEFLVCGML